MIDTRKLVRWYDFQAPVYRLWRNRYDSPLVLHLVSIIERDDHLLFQLAKGRNRCRDS